jgi:hypothetical protein
MKWINRLGRIASKLLFFFCLTALVLFGAIIAWITLWVMWVVVLGGAQ